MKISIFRSKWADDPPPRRRRRATVRPVPPKPALRRPERRERRPVYVVEPWRQHFTGHVVPPGNPLTYTLDCSTFYPFGDRPEKYGKLSAHEIVFWTRVRHIKSGEVRYVTSENFAGDETLKQGWRQGFRKRPSYIPATAR